MKSEGDLREFRRFNKIGNGVVGWAVSLDRWDGIIFEAKRDIWVYGVGIYGAFDNKKHRFKIKYKWVIQNTPNGDTIQ